jgi:hypothetical protein
LVIEDWFGVEDLKNILCFYGGWTVMQIEDDAGHALLAEGNQDAAANDGICAAGNRVGERHVEGHGYGDVAEVGHGTKSIVAC